MTNVITSPEAAAAILKRGGLVALPTETVYGLGANALDPVAVARIFAAKERPFFDPLIVHLANVDWLPRVATEFRPCANWKPSAGKSRPPSMIWKPRCATAPRDSPEDFPRQIR